jgi:hypothetical protein
LGSGFWEKGGDGAMEAGIRNQESALEPKTENLKLKTDLLEALAWLDYCLGEAEIAAAAAKVILGRNACIPVGTPGEIEISIQNIHIFFEMLAHITTMRGRWARWGKDGF